MKHLVIIPVYSVLFILSFVIGGIMWLYSFDKKHLYMGTSFINSKVIKFTHWYKLTRDQSLVFFYYTLDENIKYNIMKKISYVLTVMVLVVLVMTSCARTGYGCHGRSKIMTRVR